MVFAGLALIWVSGDPGLGSGTMEASMQATSSFLIDDFSSEQGTSAMGTEWRLFRAGLAEKQWRFHPSRASAGSGRPALRRF